MNQVILSPIESDGRIHQATDAQGVTFTWQVNGRITNHLRLSHVEVQRQSVAMLSDYGTTQTCKTCFIKYGVFLAAGDCECGKRPSWELWQEFGYPLKMDWRWADTSS